MTATDTTTQGWLSDHEAAAILHQVGRGNLLAVSGGRHARGTDRDVILPVAHGYDVRIRLEPSDTYTVRRTFRRGGKVWTKATWSGVYADEVGEVAYQASCYLDAPEGADR